MGLRPGSWGLNRVKGRNEQRVEDSRIFWAFGQDSPAVQLGLWLCGFAMKSHELDGSFLTGAQRCQPLASLGGVTQAKMGSVRPCPKGIAVYVVFQKDSSRQRWCGGSGPEAGEGQRKVCSTVSVQRLRKEQERVDESMAEAEPQI